MDNNEPHYETLQEQLNAQQEALTQIYKSVEKTRKMIFWSGVINTLVFVLPLIAVMVLLPKIMNTFTTSLNGLGDVVNISSDIVAEPSLRESLENLQNLQNLGL